MDKHPSLYFPKLWNDLPEYLKVTGNKNTFNSKLKYYLLAKDS